MTEEEARNKWCPMVRGALFNEFGACGGNASPGDNSKCIASDCMMWRWKPGPTEGKPRHGYCGLAGKP